MSVDTELTLCFGRGQCAESSNLKTRIKWSHLCYKSIMTIVPSGKGVSVTREFLQPTKEMPIKPSLLIVTNAKDNEIFDLICYHALLIPCCFAHW